MSDLKPDFERIWLTPACCGEFEGERLWCENSMGNCDEGNPDTEYVRADLYEALQARAEKAEAALILAQREIDRLLEDLTDE